METPSLLPKGRRLSILLCAAALLSSCMCILPVGFARRPAAASKETLFAPPKWKTSDPSGITRVKDLKKGVRKFKRAGSHRRKAKKSKQALISYLQDDSTPAGKTLWALRIFQVRGLFTTSWEYILGMKKLTQVGQWEDALILWGLMQKKGLEETPTTYSAAIVALSTGGQWQRALAVYDEMEEHNMAPIRVGAEHALLACEKGALWEKSIHLLEQLWAAGEMPSESSYMPVIRACENAGRVQVADKLFWQMRDQTKLVQVAEETGMGVVADREPPKAALAPWRIPGAVAPDAYIPPKDKLLLGDGKQKTRHRRKSYQEYKVHAWGDQDLYAPTNTTVETN
eukprot:TRINITY_DN11502_c0_g1_i1.p1 TRINITY_DN11502_c0_g1~~TRINITY_DN11502_c0_g1_i1.p1  ORF type:complete len:341 (-),score=46.17 TRINITY_DN11502_c0_g1_i1:76-1098(-)